MDELEQKFGYGKKHESNKMNFTVFNLIRLHSSEQLNVLVHNVCFRHFYVLSFQKDVQKGKSLGQPGLESFISAYSKQRILKKEN